MAEISAEKRVLLAFALSFLVLLGWSAYMRERHPTPEGPPQAETPPGVPAGRLEPEPTPAVPRRAAAVGGGAVAVKQGEAEHTMVVESAKTRITLSTRGGRITSWKLKEYKDNQGEVLELVQGRGNGLGFPLDLVFGGSHPEGAKREERLRQALFVASPVATSMAAPADLQLEWSDGEWAVRKQFHFRDGYEMEIETQVSSSGVPLGHRVAWAGGFGETAEEGNATAGTEAQVFLRTPAGLQRQPARQAGETTGRLWKTPSPFPYRGEASYAGIEDRYFAAIFLPPQPQLEVTVWTSDWKPAGEEKVRRVGAIAAGGVGESNRVRLFVGPKAIHVLEQVSAAAFSTGSAPRLAEDLVDFGWFWWVAQPVFVGMRWMYDHWMRNYGWVIILLTVLINTVLFPLKWKSMLSAWKMQKLAPQLRAIQERYKQYKFNDPRKQQMQVEMMGLYKQHGVNPLGGCFPLLVQIPFFYGFYRVLATAIELRQAPWVGWIRDLSQKDPYYILPIVMTLTMFLSMRMTPTTVDPSQQRMMYIFLFVFGYTFLFFSSGLVLYWLASSVVGIGQQWWMNRHQRKLELRHKLEAKERKKKKQPA